MSYDARMVARPSAPSGSVEGTRTSGSGIETILAFTDFSSHAAVAIGRAAQLADQHRSSLRLVHVVEPPLLASHDWSKSIEGCGRVASAETELAATARSLNCGSTVDVQVLVGSVIDEILRVADQADLLVMGARGLSPVKRALLGTMAMRLSTSCNRAILVVKQEKTDPYSQVLVPIDLRDDAQTTLQAAQALAPDAQLHVLHAYQGPEGALHTSSVSKDTLQRGRSTVRAKVQARLDAVLTRAEQGTPHLLAHVSRDHPVRSTLSTETCMRADLIVMSKRSRSKLEDALLGSTTKRVVEDSHCDVLVVPILPTPKTIGAGI